MSICMNDFCVLWGQKDNEKPRAYFRELAYFTFDSVVCSHFRRTADTAVKIWSTDTGPFHKPTSELWD